MRTSTCTCHMYMGRVHVGNMSMYVHVKVGNQVSVNHTQDLLEILEYVARPRADQKHTHVCRDDAQLSSLKILLVAPPAHMLLNCDRLLGTSGNRSELELALLTDRCSRACDGR